MLPTQSQKLLPSIVGYKVDVSLEPEKRGPGYSRQPDKSGNGELLFILV